MIVFRNELPLFSRVTIALDVMALVGVAVIVFVLTPDLRMFLSGSKTVMADGSMPYGLAAFSLITLRLAFAVASIRRNFQSQPIEIGLLAVTVLLPMIVFVFHEPLLTAWARHCGYTLDHTISDYDGTKYVFVAKV